jgi:predicted secreted protein
VRHHAAGVKRLLLLVEKNPSVLAAVFDVTDAVEANFNTRVKMGQSSNVYRRGHDERRQGAVRAARKSRSRSAAAAG